MSDRTSQEQFEREVFPAELEEVVQRRSALGLPAVDGDGRPAVANNLVGLALSGGGIRSATFCLGAVQALARTGHLRSIDYLSTVSGGGYLGSCVSALLRDGPPCVDQDTFPLRHSDGTRETQALSHLRNSQNYLAPGGFLDKLRLPALMVRGILINLFLFMPFIIVAVLVTEVLYEVGNSVRLPFGMSPLAASVLFLALVLTSPFVTRLFRRHFNWKARNRYEHLLTGAFLVMLLLLALIPVVLIIDSAIRSSWGQVRSAISSEFAKPFESEDAWKWLLAVGLFLLLTIVGRSSERIARLSNRLLLFTIGLIGPIVLIAIFLLLLVFQIDSPFLDPDMRTTLDAREFSPALKDALKVKGIPLETDAAIEVHEAGSSWTIDTGARKFQVSYVDGDLRLRWRDLWDAHHDVIFFGIGIFFLLFNTFFVDINLTSAHSFYRDRLSKAYMMYEDTSGKVVHDDERKLTELAAPGSAAPYHVINVALNLQGSDEAELRGRNAGFFFFGKRYSGGDRTGFIDTQDLETHDANLNLATAMAISGAAASPNMGATTVKPLVFMLTLLNVRLGYWLPNPAKVHTASWFGHIRMKLGAGPRHLLKEATGQLDADGPFVNLSDGGHIENLGVYELLRRRCALIVSVDAEADPTLSFSSLIRLILYAQIDMGIEIEMDLTPIRPDEQGRSSTHFAIGTVHYGGGETGKLVYLKASRTGDENDYVQAYQRRFPDFPHESTANQFFDEEQFEAYRALGFHVARGALEDEEVQASLALPTG